MNETQSWYAPWAVPGEYSAAIWALAASIVVSAGLVLILIPPLRRVAWWTGYLDHPEARKLHTKATPLLGGLAVFLAILASSYLGIRLLGMPVPQPAHWWIIGAAGAFCLGLWDDRFGMRPVPKLILQFSVGLLFLAGGVYPRAFGDLLSFPLSLLWIVSIMNATNFLDNMDGIVGGLGCILSAGLGILLLSWGYAAEAIYAFSLSAACLAFLRFNFYPASVFLGDAGSLFIGYSLAALSLLAAYAGPGVQASAAALLILGYPAFDLCFVIVIRIREGRKIYQGGQDHTTHRLSRLVRGPRRTLFWLYLCAAALTFTGVALAYAQGLVQVVLWISVWAFWLFLLGLRLARIRTT
jgi:UDP-GlcNAc:undecaprenyl-phosphate GlcNAc-1-phosphate transferase